MIFFKNLRGKDTGNQLSIKEQNTDWL